MTDALNDCIKRMLNGDDVDMECVCSVKEEPLVKEKVDAGVSRLYGVTPMHEFLLQRRFFMGVLATFTHKNIRVFSAMGLDPKDARALHDWLLEGLKDPFIFTMDYKKKDRSFLPVYFDEVVS